jgi:hypothetical protein
MINIQRNQMHLLIGFVTSHYHWVHKSGNVIFLQNGGIKKIDNVLLIHGVTKNLLSLGAFANKGWFVIFGLKKCWVLTIVTPKKLVARGV